MAPPNVSADFFEPEPLTPLPHPSTVHADLSAPASPPISTSSSSLSFSYSPYVVASTTSVNSAYPPTAQNLPASIQRPDSPSSISSRPTDGTLHSIPSSASAVALAAAAAAAASVANNKAHNRRDKAPVPPLYMPSSSSATTTTFLSDASCTTPSCAPCSIPELTSKRCSCMHVAIIGAGIAGVSVATTLAKRLGNHTSTTISLIDPRNYVEIRWAVIRSLFDPSIAKSCVLSLEEGLVNYPSIRHIPARVLSLTANTITLHNGAVLPFDVCLLATGSVPDYSLLSAPHTDVKKRREQLADEGRRLTRASSVLIVGGGPVGAELAGYLCCHARKEKRTPQVTLVHHGRQLVDPLGSRASHRLADQLSGLGVKLILGEKADFSRETNRWVIRSTGQVLNAAEVVTPTGVHAAPGGAGDLLRGMLKSGVDALVDKGGWVQVDKFGRVGKQVSPTNTIFAMGDCTQQPYKSGVTIIANRKNMAHNLHVAIEACIAQKRGQEYYVEKKLRPILTPSTTSLSVLAGPNAGVVQTKFFVDDILLPTWRSRVTMSLSKVRTDLGL